MPSDRILDALRHRGLFPSGTPPTDDAVIAVIDKLASALTYIAARGPDSDPDFRATWTEEVVAAYNAGERRDSWVTAKLARRALKGDA